MEELIKRSLQGDQDAYIKLIESIQVEMYKIATSQLNNIDDINDVIKETIMHSYDKLHTLKNFNYFKTWIIRILINECNIIHRKRKKQLGLFNKISNSVDNSTYTNNIFQEVESNIDFDLLIQHLNYNERLIFTLYYRNKYTPTEISNILNINVNTVKSRISRAKQKIQNLYKKGGMHNEKK